MLLNGLGRRCLTAALVERPLKRLHYARRFADFTCAPWLSEEFRFGEVTSHLIIARPNLVSRHSHQTRVSQLTMQQ